MLELYLRLRRRARHWLGLFTGLTGEDCLTQSAEYARRSVPRDCELAELFFVSSGRFVHKWAHYLPIYERWLDRYRGTSFHMLEIGVSEGGSLELWRRYFGPDATIFGIDIDPVCAERVDPPNQVRIGSQADPEFLRSVVAEMGAPDVILDDGSHVAGDQRASFKALFPILREGGLYIIEDTHSACWRQMEGGYRRPGTAIEFAKSIVDDMHAWYHDYPTRTSARDEIAGVSFFDSMIVFEKRRRERPISVKIGTPNAASIRGRPST